MAKQRTVDAIPMNANDSVPVGQTMSEPQYRPTLGEIAAKHAADTKEIMEANQGSCPAVTPPEPQRTRGTGTPRGLNTELQAGAKIDRLLAEMPTAQAIRVLRYTLERYVAQLHGDEAVE